MLTVKNDTYLPSTTNGEREGGRRMNGDWLRIMKMRQQTDG
jgi:hypothetical protein